MKLIKLEDDKKIDILNKINDYKNPTTIYIPKDNSDYEIGDYIYKNTYINDYICSVSGYINGIEKKLINNKLIDCYVIENDFKENTKIKGKKQNIKNKDELITLLSNFKLNKLKEKIENVENITNLIVTSIDEENCFVNEFIRLSSNYLEVLDTIDFICDILKIKNITLATKNTNAKSIRKVKSILGTYPNIDFILVPDKYLIGNKEYICEYLNKDISATLVLTTTEVFDIYNVIYKGKRKTEKLITISGDVLAKSKIINIRLNTLLTEIVVEYIKFTDKDYNIFINGFLGGYQVDSIENIVVTQNIDSIIFIKKNNVTTECINCGACNKICPNNINVKKYFEEETNSNKCIGCGLCNYICPANINLKKVVKGEKL